MNVKELMWMVESKSAKIDSNEWLFTSFYGEYSDSPRKISELLHERKPDIKISWIVKKGALNVPEYINKVYVGTKEAEIVRHRAKVIIDNIYGENGFYLKNNMAARIKTAFLVFMRKVKGQKIYTSWHGVPLKRLGGDEVNGHYIDFLCNDITMFVNSSYEETIMRRVTFNRIKIKKLGMPRNDVLFCECDNGVKEKLGISCDKRIILFAPTFRRDENGITESSIARSGIEQIESIDFSVLYHVLNERFGSEWLFICRFHSQVSEKIDWEDLAKRYSGSIINGNAINDMADLLACADILITDASSCMYDFMLTLKPCFIFFPDIKHYQNIERGLYRPIDSLPFPFATTFEQLITQIRTFDYLNYQNEARCLMDEFGFVDDGCSGLRVLDYILQDQNL